MKNIIFLSVTVAIALTACTHKSGITTSPLIDHPPIIGCMDTQALNYDPTATQSDFSQCVFALDSVTGTYSVTDTDIEINSATHPDTFYSSVDITVTRVDGRTLRFDKIIKYPEYNAGDVPYDHKFRQFYFMGHSSPHSGSRGNGRFKGDTLTYFVSSWNDYGFYCPSHRGRGQKRK